MRFHTIAGAAHTPLTETQHRLLGEVCQLKEGQRVLDLACGDGALLAQWAQAYGVTGVGVDMHGIDRAKDRAYQLSVRDKITFIEDDPASYPEAHHQFEVVSWLGALPAGIPDTLRLMQPALRADSGLLVVGSPYWRETPPEAACDALDIAPEALLTLPELAGHLVDFDLVEMVLVEPADWDRYEARQWMNVSTFLQEHPRDGAAGALRAWMQANRRAYLTYGRRYIGWGAFVLRPLVEAATPPQIENPNRPVGLRIADDTLWVRLADGRVIGNPLAWYPWLERATSDEMDNFVFTSVGVEWPELERRIDVQDMLA